MSRQRVEMQWTRKKAIEFLKDTYTPMYLRSLTDRQLFDLGIKEGLWHPAEMEVPLV